ncbi:putative inorganic carbon transporter subunit DabA [Methylomonas koyamae]|uniref:putative inorganic carbon transporter subunit DabA n=1 Tax=Methylomonas koyamae TaxID=702114 RepID=UPI0035712BA4
MWSAPWASWRQRRRPAYRPALQSLHDGRNLRHEPLRLSVFIEAPAAMIEQVLEHQAGVRQLVENRWLHLLRIDPNQLLLSLCRSALLAAGFYRPRGVLR